MESVFLREAQAVWPWCAPTWTTEPAPVPVAPAYPRTRGNVPLVSDDELARFAGALVRISLLPARTDPLGNQEHPAVVE